MLCSETVFVNANRFEGSVHLLRCKKWGCPTCHEYNRMKVMHAARKGRPNLFMTLTSVEGSAASPDEAARDMKRGLVLLRRRIERRWGVKNIPFIVVFERTKRGWPHMHLLLRAPYMHWKVLRAMWQAISGAHQVDVRFIKKQTQVLFYVTKYIGKELAAFEGCKRWWRSHNYEVVKEEKLKLHPIGPWFEKDFIPWDKVVEAMQESGAISEKIGRYKYKWRWRNGLAGGVPWRRPVKLTRGPVA